MTVHHREALEVYRDLSTVRVSEAVRAVGDGNRTRLKGHVRQVRPPLPVDDVVRFETPPDITGVRF